MSLINPAPTVAITTKILYGIGEIANSVKMVLFGLFTLYFYTTVMGLSARLVGIASAIGLFWDACIDPFIGWYSDRISSRWGKRHPFILVGAVSMGVCMWAFFSPPRGLSQALLFAWLLVSSLLVRTVTSLYGIPYYCLGAELSGDYFERTQITGIRSAWALAGTLMAATLPFVLFFPDPGDGTDPKFNYHGYPLMGCAFGMLMTCAGLIAWRGTRAGVNSLDGGPRTADRGPQQFFRNVLVSLKNRSFLILFCSFSLFFLGVVTNGLLSIHFLTYYVGIHSSTAISTFQLSFYIGALVGVGFWTPLSKKHEKRPLYFISTLCTSLVMGGAFLLFGQGHVFGTGNITALSIGHGLAGFFASILWILPASMIADVTDEDALATGTRREGTFFGIFFFGQQIAAGVSLLLTGVLAEDFAGLIPGAVSQSPGTVVRLAMIYSLVPAGLLMAAAFLILGYTLDQAKVERFQNLMTRSSRNRTGTYPFV